MALPTNRSARIAYVLFLDIVGYSRETTSAEARLIEQLNAAVHAAPAFAVAHETGAVQILPTGDGMALVFYNDVLAPVQTAAHIGRTVQGAALPLRMGIHSGLVLPQVDVTGRENLVGEGLNTAQRVMNFGDAGHILLSAQYAAWLQHFEEWADLLHPLGEGTAKHNVQILLYNLLGDGFGLVSVPTKLDRSANVTVLSRTQNEAPLEKSYPVQNEERPLPTRTFEPLPQTKIQLPDLETPPLSFPSHLERPSRNNMVFRTGGDWDSTTLFNNGQEVMASQLLVQLRTGQDDDEPDRHGVNNGGDILAIVRPQDDPEDEIEIFPGHLEIDFPGHSILIENVHPMSDFASTRVWYNGRDVTDHLVDVYVDINAIDNVVQCSIALYKAHGFGSDEVATIHIA